jgi:hypothetical protein
MEMMEELYDTHIQTIKRSIEEKLRQPGAEGTGAVCFLSL